MAVTITRTPWVDDDGTGTTGTVINNAVKTALYNDIDGALAKVAQLAGANTFTGTQTVPALNSAAVLSFLTANAERMRIAATGEVAIGTAAPATVAALYVVADLQAKQALTIQNLTAPTGGYYQMFLNSAAALAGGILQSGVTTVNYSTTSDARLKDDAGRATELAALRAVVVHDFAWKADGRADRGVFAQEAHVVCPRAITVGSDETTADGHLARPWMTDYSKFVPDLIVGWQQHDATLAELIACLERMKG